jgi:hypothetical protein
MDTENRNPQEDKAQDADDSVRNLYVGLFEQAKGSVQSLIQTGEPPPGAIMWGEVLVYGHIENETFVVERLRRVALYGTLENLDEGSEESERIGIFSLAGPLEEPVVQEGSIENFSQQLHYAALSSELDPFVAIDDATFPQMEQMAATLTWSQEGKPDEKVVQLVVSLTSSLVEETQKLGVVQVITLDPINIVFYRAGSGAPKPTTPLRSLQGNCLPPAACPSPNQDVMRLPLKFVNFSTNSGGPNNGGLPYDCNDPLSYEPPPDIESICNAQIDKVCEVWRNKAALQLDVQIQLETISDGPVLVTCQEIQAYADFNTIDLNAIRSPIFSHNNVNYVEVYLVNSIIYSTPGGGETGGGIAFFSSDNNTASTVCFLEVAAARVNPYLLSHELGHMLGLAHPDGSYGIMDSSLGSILEPAPNPPYNPPYNTLYNCRIFDDSNIGSLNPIVSTTTVDDCFHPDQPDHLIRDFPADSGVEPSVPPSGQNVWSDTNVWNRRRNSPGGLLPSGGPKHEEPLVSTDINNPIKNFMHVRLERLTAFVQPVTVELYLSDPGASSFLRPIGANYRLTFATRPRSTYRSLPWIVPVGHPSHSSVFALSYSNDAPSSVTDPTLVNSGNLDLLVRSDNGIAQRNLHIQEITLMNPRSLTTTLPWVQIENLLDKAAQAKLEIDTTQATQLNSLFLQVNDQIVDEITLGQVATIEIAEHLQPAERRILRFQATIPPGLPEGTELPIHLRFIVGDQFINGYTHILRVAPFSATVVQVLDTLFSALRDMCIGCPSHFGQNLAEQAKKIVVREHQKMESRGCLGLLWSIFRPKSKWRSQVTNLCEGIAAHVQSLEVRSEPEYQVVSQKLSELGMLLSNSQGMEDILLIESIRDRADRIQEPAGQLARQQLQT